MCSSIPLVTYCIIVAISNRCKSWTQPVPSSCQSIHTLKPENLFSTNCKSLASVWSQTKSTSIQLTSKFLPRRENWMSWPFPWICASMRNRIDWRSVPCSFCTWSMLKAWKFWGKRRLQQTRTRSLSRRSSTGSFWSLCARTSLHTNSSKTEQSRAPTTAKPKDTPKRTSWSAR